MLLRMSRVGCELQWRWDTRVSELGKVTDKIYGPYYPTLFYW